jgi:hypothetical protein
MNLSEWLDEVMPAIAGAEVGFVQRHILYGAIDFCKMSLAWNEDAAPINIVVDTAAYNLVSPITNTEIVEVMELYVDSEIVTPSTWREITDNYADAKTLTGSAIHYVQNYAEKLTLFKIPNAAITGGLTYKVAIKPTRIATVINDSIGSRYYDAIADAAKARLFEIPSKPWSDGQASLFYKSKFEAAAQAARDEIVSGLGRGSVRTKIYY